MRVIIDKTLYQLTLWPRFFPVNCYLVEEEDSLTLVDAAMNQAAPSIQKEIKKIGKPLKRIVLTHAHGDHVGALDVIKASYPEAEVFISKRDARLLRGDVSLDSDEPSTPIKGGVPKTLKTREDHVLSEGDHIGSLMAIESPGHTPGSLSFLDTRTQHLIAGDAFVTRSGVAVSGELNWRFPFPAWATWNKEVALDSARKLMELNPTVLAVGHGELIHTPKNQMETAIGRLEKALIKKQS